MVRVSSATWTLLLFAAFLLAGATALATATVMMGHMIIEAGDGSIGPVAVIAAGSLVGALASYVVHEITALAPGVVRDITRSRA